MPPTQLGISVFGLLSIKSKSFPVGLSARKRDLLLSFAQLCFVVQVAPCRPGWPPFLGVEKKKKKKKNQGQFPGEMEHVHCGVCGCIAIPGFGGKPINAPLDTAATGRRGIVLNLTGNVVFLYFVSHVPTPPRPTPCVKLPLQTFVNPVGQLGHAHFKKKKKTCPGPAGGGVRGVFPCGEIHKRVVENSKPRTKATQRHRGSNISQPGGAPFLLQFPVVIPRFRPSGSVYFRDQIPCCENLERHGHHADEQPPPPKFARPAVSKFIIW